VADYTLPTTAEFFERFPEFEAMGVEEPAVAAALLDAARRVDTTWTAGDYPTAILYLAAHFVSVNADAVGGGLINSESFGPISVSYARAASPDGLTGSAYGQRFFELVSLNIGGPLVV
jgi:hypothetical protein